MLYIPGISTNFHWIFYKVPTNQYIITNEEELKDGGLADLLDDGYEIIWDSALTKAKAKELVHEQINSFLDWYQKDYPLDTLMLEMPKPLKLRTVPLTFREACEFVNQHHRHHESPQGHKFSIGLSDGDKLVGVAIAGNPVCRHMAEMKSFHHV